MNLRQEESGEGTEIDVQSVFADIGRQTICTGLRLMYTIFGRRAVSDDFIGAIAEVGTRREDLRALPDGGDIGSMHIACHGRCFRAR